MLAATAALSASSSLAPTHSASAEDPQILQALIRLSDRAAVAVKEEPPDRDGWRVDPSGKDYYMFFVDSYAVRALAVAYELTGNRTYLEACATWSDRMLRHQAGMIPAGAYYMNYHRKPGEKEGQWFSADSGSIAMGVLATALLSEGASRERYIASGRAYADLVMSRYVRPTGGVTDGIWEISDQEWWCSTALFAATAFQLHGVTEEMGYRQAALHAVDWLLDFEYGDTEDLYTFVEGAPTTIFYILEAYSSALPYLEPSDARTQRVHARFTETVEWIVNRQNQAGTWDYNPDNWGVKLGGLPCHLLTWLAFVPDEAGKRRSVISSTGRRVSFENRVEAAVRSALDYFARQSPDTNVFTQQQAFTMMSFAERLRPGMLYRSRQ